MPRLDGRGPSAMGAGTGRKRGNCNFVDGKGYGLGRGLGKGLGICRDMDNNTLSEKEILEQRREMLEMELNAVKGRLNNKDTSQSK